MRLGWGRAAGPGAVAALAGLTLAPLATAQTGPVPAERLQASGVALTRLPPVAQELMVRELGEVLAPAGVALGWRWSAAESQARSDELLVIFLDSTGRGAHAGRMVLACSGDNGIVTSVWVYVPNVMEALGLSGEAPPESLGARRELGLALGRVVAHEVVHALAPDLEHGEGLMSHRFHLGQLVDDRPRLDEGGTRVLAMAARRWRTDGGLRQREIASRGRGVPTRARP